MKPLLIATLCLATLVPAAAHDDDKKPKTPTRATSELRKAREAMDSYKTRLESDGKYSCCVTKPKGVKTDGCDVCARVNGSCNCGVNLAAGKGVCGDCYGGWKTGRGMRAYREAAGKRLTILDSTKQAIGSPVPVAERPTEFIQYTAAMTAAKKMLVVEKRFSCCVSKGGCDECAHEGYCGCLNNLAVDAASEPGKKKAGICGQCIDGQHAGAGRLENIDLKSLTLAVMEMGEMAGSLGAYSMAREGSGTAWIPESSPMFARMGRTGLYRTMQMGTLFGVYANSGGPRGSAEPFIASQYMAMFQRETGGGTLGLRVMASLDPLLAGSRGYPNLFQTGETNRGLPLQDRQHPHDLLMEVAATYSKKLVGDSRGYLYLAPIGEPPIGPSAFQHRPSAWDNPIAPISHHWLDGTHITYGVVTAGAIFGGNRWKIEGSVFNGREPDERRWDYDSFRLNSHAARLSYNPNSDWSLQASHAFLRSPESLEPGVNAHRVTISAMHNRSYINGDNWSTMMAWGRNSKAPKPSTDALLLESAYTLGKTTLFARYDNTRKDEIPGVPSGIHRIEKWSLGGVYNFTSNGAGQQGLGASLDWYRFPEQLKSVYGSAPVSFNLFYRLRFGRM